MIYLLRHGETIWNVERRIQGQQDSPLTLRGIVQAGTMAGLLRERIDDLSAFTIVASPLGRAWQTAVIVAQSLGLHHGAIRFEPRLQEHHFGAWQGLLWAEIKEAFPRDWEQRSADKWNFVVPGGESYALVAARVGNWLAEQDDEADLIVVAHGLAGRVLRGLYAKLPQEEVMTLSEPQDSVHRLAQGTIATVGAD